jgi:hypothetical protein
MTGQPITLADISPAMRRAGERRQFARIRLPGGIFKTTIAGRLRDLDQATVDVLGAPRPLEVIDVGASSGSTTLDLVGALRDAGHTPRVLLSDIAIHARLVQMTPDHAVLLTPGNQLLQHVIRGVPVRPWRRRLDAFTQYWILTRAANARFRRLRAQGALERAPAATDVLMVLSSVAADPAIRCEEADVFAAPDPAHLGAFDLVRAANLLIPGVFPEDRLRLGIEGLVARLKGPGALLVLARSPAPGQPGQTRATIYRVAEGGALEAAARLGGGSELEALVPAGLPGT